MPQTSITPNAKGLPGLLGDARFHTKTSAAQAEASAEMCFGIAVKEGAAGDQCLLLTATTNLLKGIVVRDDWYSYPEQLGDTGVKPKNNITLLESGCIWVIVEELPTNASAVHCRAVATGNEIAGSFRATADSTDCIDCSGFAKWTGRTDTVDGVMIAELTGNFVMRHLAVADT